MIRNQLRTKFHERKNVKNKNVVDTMSKLNGIDLENCSQTDDFSFEIESEHRLNRTQLKNSRFTGQCEI